MLDVGSVLALPILASGELGDSGGSGSGFARFQGLQSTYGFLVLVQVARRVLNSEFEFCQSPDLGIAFQFKV